MRTGLTKRSPLICSTSCGQHQHDEGRTEQYAAIDRLRLEPNSSFARAPAVYSIRPEVVAKIADEPVLGRAHPCMAHAPAPIHGRLTVPAAAQCSKPPRQRRHEPRHVLSK